MDIYGWSACPHYVVSRLSVTLPAMGMSCGKPLVVDDCPSSHSPPFLAQVDIELMVFVMELLSGLQRDLSASALASKAAACDDLFMRVNAVPWSATYTGARVSRGLNHWSCNGPLGESPVYAEDCGVDRGGRGMCACTWNLTADVTRHAKYARDICHALGEQ